MNTPLHIAAGRGDADQVVKLIRQHPEWVRAKCKVSDTQTDESEFYVVCNACSSEMNSDWSSRGTRGDGCSSFPTECMHKRLIMHNSSPTEEIDTLN
jgi:hypothetical protein